MIPFLVFFNLISFCSFPWTSGSTILPEGESCSIRFSGRSSAAAVIIMAS
jgi:hypothetical protein